VTEFVRKVLEMSRLNTVFDTHESEEKAVAAFYGPGARAEAPVPTGRSVLCLDSNADVLAYVRELLRRAGYDVQSSSRIADALLLMRVTHFDLLLVGPGMTASPASPLDLLLVGPGMTASPASPPAFRDACARLPVIELGSEFSTSHAGEAAAGLLEAIAARLNSKTA
jgi:hypothetical protein